jgi:sarcosine oxidase, subunit gamma
MPDTAARSLPPVRKASWLRLLPPAMRLVLHGDAQVRAAAAAAWGAGFSEHACRAVTQGTRATLWLGPDEYLLYGADEAAKDGTLAALQGALGNLPCALVDISHRQFALEVSGAHAATILNGACPLDLDPSQFPIGMCTRTVLAKADIVLWRTRGDAFHLEVWRSFSGYVTGLLHEIAGELHGA